MCIFVNFQNIMKPTIFSKKKKNHEHGFFKLYQVIFIFKSQEQTTMSTWVRAGEKFDFSTKKHGFSVIVNISVFMKSCLLCSQFSKCLETYNFFKKKKKKIISMVFLSYTKWYLSSKVRNRRRCLLESELEKNLIFLQKDMVSL